MENGTLKIALATTLIVMGAGVAVAKGPGGERALPTFEELDADASGEITIEDFATLRDNRFAEMDSDGNGSVSQAEFVAAAESKAAERAAQRFAQLDADNDGALSRDVLESRGRGGMGERMLSRLDEDNSGGVSAEEFEAGMEKLAERRGGKRKGHGRDRGHN